jgi:hypothetical protein
MRSKDFQAEGLGRSDDRECPVCPPKRPLIPSIIDQNPCAHWRKPMDMMRQGCSTSLFHASQQ